MPRHRRYVSNEAIFGTFSLLLNTYQTRGMVLDKMTTAEVGVLLRLPVEMECEELELVMQ